MLNLDYKVVLGSKSPRRQELLKGLDIDFISRVVETDERYPESLILEGIPEYLAKKKAKAQKEMMLDGELLITADTLVFLKDRTFEKPKDREESIEMLSSLSGKTHKVVTGVALTSNKKEISFSDLSLVTFSELSPNEISYYVDKYKPFDKAGSYGVQEWLGYVAIERIEGSYYNVMGLPLHKLFKELSKF